MSNLFSIPSDLQKVTADKPSLVASQFLRSDSSFVRVLVAVAAAAALTVTTVAATLGVLTCTETDGVFTSCL